jgi:hypothetical protein
MLDTLLSSSPKCLQVKEHFSTVCLLMWDVRNRFLTPELEDHPLLAVSKCLQVRHYPKNNSQCESGTTVV